MSEENLTTEKEVKPTKPRKLKIINNVTMQDGTVKNFGERGKILSTVTVLENGFNILFHIVTGEQILYNHAVNGSVDPITLEMAAFGIANRIKAAIVGSVNEEIASVVNTKLNEIKSGNFTTRKTGEAALSPLSQIQTAYAKVNGIDISTSEGALSVQAMFAAMTKEQKSALYKVKEIKIALLDLQRQAVENS